MTVVLKSPVYASKVVAPTSKSVAHRALIAAAFADRKTVIPMRVSCEDIDATARCLMALGVGITKTDSGLAVTPIARDSIKRDAVLDCGESGSTLRFLLPVCAALGANVTFIRRGRLPQRPLSPLDEELRRHGLTLLEQDEKLMIRGKISAGDYSIAANISSQYITGLLFALSLLDAPSTLTLTGKVESAPYIDMTTDMLSRFDASPTVCGDYTAFSVAGYQAKPLCSPQELIPEGDFSGAAFPLALGAIGTHAVTVTGLTLPSLQGDSAILELLARFGAKIKSERDTVTISPAPLFGIDIDATQIPDLVPILAVVATAASGTTRITGAKRLRLKESDRLAAITAFLRTLGGDITENDDGLTIVGGKPLGGGTVDVCGDHRIAMSAAAAALLTKEAITIPYAECVQKSYPTFFDEVVLPTHKE
ncbi:MAG: 3-phosphoshikimate 1-carboxyvinyltransferase [Ruminococcaceae bacterium]|nr:3-phosphoshikimate 1-carboxyvinyltransferase [Oscillospiraceae bacterium]